MNEEKCPRCGKDLVVHGTVGVRGGFRPKELKLFSLSFQIPRVTVPTGFAACAACGLLWGQIDAASLRQKLHDLGNDEIKKHLGLDGSD